MATIAQTPGSALFSSPVLQLLQAMIGGTQDQTIVKDGTSNVAGTSTNNGTQSGTTSNATTGSTSTTGSNNTAGTTSNATTGSTSTTGTTGTTGTTAGVTNQTQQKTADVTALKKVFEQQQAGITPELLAAIFSEGSKAAPGLVSTMANAVGARAADNTPLATALASMSTGLTSKAAELSAAQQNASANTAAQIAEATGGTQTTGSNNQTNDQQVATSQLQQLLQNVLGSNNQTTDTTQLQQVLQNVLGTSNQTNTQTGTTGSNTTTTDNTKNSMDSQMNTGNISQLLGGLLGGSLLNSGLQGAGLGGIGGVVGGAAKDAGGLIAQLLKGLMPQQQGGTAPPFSLDSILGGWQNGSVADSVGQNPFTGDLNPASILPGFGQNNGFDFSQFMNPTPALDAVSPDWWDAPYDANQWGDY